MTKDEIYKLNDMLCRCREDFTAYSDGRATKGDGLLPGLKKLADCIGIVEDEWRRPDDGSAGESHCRPIDFAGQLIDRECPAACSSACSRSSECPAELVMRLNRSVKITIELQ